FGMGELPHSGKRLESLDLRRKCEAVAGDPGPIKRLDAEKVSSQEENLALQVEHGKGKHADQARQAVGPPVHVSVQQHLGVRLRLEAAARAEQLIAQLEVVVDLAVVSDGVLTIRGSHRLPAGFGQIENGQSPVQEQRAPGLPGNAPFAATL